MVRGSAPVEDSRGGDTSCWANLPQELLRDVLVRIEASESWRHIIKDLLKVPEFCDQLTFPIFVKQVLIMALADDGKFLLSAYKWRRPTCTDFVISLHADDMSKGSQIYVEKLRSNFLGTKFTVFDGHPPHAGAKIFTNLAGNYPVAHISYELNIVAVFSRPVVDNLPLLSFFRSKSNEMENLLSGPLSGQKDGALVLKNKAPRWHVQLQYWCLNFHGRVTVASDGPCRPEHDKIILQFEKVGKDLFSMDYQYPISAFQAFAICLGNFDTKIPRE
ncbi:hypothetical protein K2173_017583 [Erythroxylum novogranatense]|uniref:Tubby C-terminal domain-containing protein n=1 Tax=Erythroxylum novogranatense TaxID=1862640 RepID=A0AAV8TN10_9ROSI|nr:hypothetical protein K2173_017583 [Erythroxylum novogranatense]